MKSCTVTNCGAKHYGLGLCRLHYRRSKEGKHGMECPPCKMCGSKIVGRKVEAEFCDTRCQMKWNRRFGCYTSERCKEAYGTCSIEGCDSAVKAHGMCSAHCQKLWRYGDPLADLSPTLQPCKVCRMVVSVQHGKQPYCPRHYGNQYYYRFHVRERARRNARRTRVQIATPAWADHRAIHEFYIACPPGMHVDHVLPLKGKLVSGLHVLENLQYLEPLANRQKLNRFVV